MVKDTVSGIYDRSPYGIWSEPSNTHVDGIEWTVFKDGLYTQIRDSIADTPIAVT